MPSRQSLRALDALNFFLADVRDGVRPYLAIYLIAVRGPSHGWDEATVAFTFHLANAAMLTSVSQLLTRPIIVTEGYTIAFWTLAAIAGIGLTLYARFMPETMAWRPSREDP